MQRPAENDYSSPYADYVSLVPEDDVLPVFERQLRETQRLIASLDDTRATHRYAEGKWSVKEVIGHLTDGERIFGCRALCIARGEKSSLPGFDENAYMKAANFDAWPLDDLAEAYALARRANIVLFRNLDEDGWNRRGVANDSEITVRALAFVIAGHERHHLKVLRERYLIQV
ncbi:MAG: damage-inducible protein DinB [Acidobacteria bacterium]|nr:damage-inducible protein DinB [Acidobacteriota bacterium]